MKRNVKRKLTAKQRVLRKYPSASAEQFFGPRGKWQWCINYGYRDLGVGSTAALAWADAARRL